MNNGVKNGTQKKFLFVSHESLSGDLAWQIKKEGHEVRVYVKEKDDADVYDGILEKVMNWEEYKDWADIVIFDDVGFGDEADKLRKAEKKVIGGSSYTDRLEVDREFGQSEMKRLGLLTLPHWDFDNFDNAIKFLKENPGRYVWKPSGNTPSHMKGLLFLGTDEDGKDIIEIMESNKNSWGKKVRNFQLQKFVFGVEVAVGAFFNGNDFVYPVNVNFEHKKLFPGDIGPYTGEMGTLMFWTQPNTIFKATLEKMREELRAAHYAGYIDINCIANARGIYPLEFTCRFGYPTISIQIEGVQSQWGEFLSTLAAGEPFDLKTKKGFQIGAVVAVPPFPYDDKRTTETYKDLSIIFKKPNLDGIHLGDVKIVDGSLKIAGESGYVLVVTGSGTTVAEASQQMYNRLGSIMIQNMFYRTDIGAKWGEDSDRLHTWGYLY
ncbi:MAG: phosphoribosylamine--glycine ligase [Candidatus Harrisonbacteria bacterium RIFOXYD1_FULL_40_9]|uniref:phosphoribosylamine--glycine ligase n=1 Tax=Candidatus Harrisonbacteria bacterium RIFOXYD1_FULL_40_9 TaxID=1798412 RepID=A0A1G1ZVG7_9BACT|nr:MAG: phosphoribosylamine--glycine ligase [Candidatus Harrisonbacteria bacterium RIFOXYD1_FULL_40_9]